MKKTQTNKLKNAIREYGDLMILSGAFGKPGNTIAYVTKYMANKTVQKYVNNPKLMTKRLHRVIDSINKFI